MSRPHTSATDASIAGFLDRVYLAPRHAHKSLCLWPIMRLEDAPSQPPGYVLLADALLAGTLHIEEVGSGSVPNVRIENEGRDAVLFLFGEQIVGARQNRAANASFLVPPQSSTVVDVSCVEAGRWDRGDASFSSSDVVLGSSLRAAMARSVRASRAAGRGFDASQADVWGDIGCVLRRSGVRSRTAAYADFRSSRATDLDDLCGAFRLLPRQVGFVIAVGDEVTGIETIGRPEVFARAFDRLVRAHSIDATIAAGTGEREGPSAFDAPDDLLEAMRRARWVRGPSLGMGEDARSEAKVWTGCALICEDVVHLTAFTKRMGPKAR